VVVPGCVHRVESPSLQDGPADAWEPEAVGKAVGDLAGRLGLELVVTFDDGGVSGHANHCALAPGMRWLLAQRQEQRDRDRAEAASCQAGLWLPGAVEGGEGVKSGMHASSAGTCPSISRRRGRDHGGDEARGTGWVDEALGDYRGDEARGDSRGDDWVDEARGDSKGDGWGDCGEEARGDGEARPRRSLEVLVLETTSWARKYAGVADVAVSWWLACGEGGGDDSAGGDRSLPPRLTVPVLVVSGPADVFAALWGLLAHGSQLVWYRLLFALVARYTYVNTLRPLGRSPAGNCGCCAL
jgi:hypothetical protein